MTPLITCEHVEFGYDNQDAVVDVNMEVDAGDYLCIVGENGSGKSTLMKGLLGLLKPTAGCHAVHLQADPETLVELHRGHESLKLKSQAAEAEKGGCCHECDH